MLDNPERSNGCSRSWRRCCRCRPGHARIGAAVRLSALSFNAALLKRIRSVAGWNCRKRSLRKVVPCLLERDRAAVLGQRPGGALAIGPYQQNRRISWLGIVI